MRIKLECSWWWQRPMSVVVRLLLCVMAALSLLQLFGGLAHGSPLPDGRAWEMVSPLEKNGGDIAGLIGDSGGGVAQATPDGGAITYVSLGSFGAPRGAAIGSQYVAQRHDGEGWESRNISIPMNAQSYPPTAGEGTPYRMFSPELTSALVWGGPHGPSGFFEGLPLAGAPTEYENYYFTQFPSNGLQLQPVLSKEPSRPASEFAMSILGTTPDLQHIVVESPAVLGESGAEVEGGHNLYEWSQANGRFSAVNFLPLPNGNYEPGSILFGGLRGAIDHAISEDGSRIIWTSLSTPTALYLRENLGTEHPVTTQVDGPAGAGRFLTASGDDSKIFFADTTRLTADSTAGSSALGDLYRFEPDGKGGGTLSDLSIDHMDPEGAEVLGVLGASADGSYLYFVANGVLDIGSAASRGNCQLGKSARGATCNLYLWHEGWKAPRFIAKLAGEDEFEEAGFAALGAAYDWDGSLDVRTARVSSDGNRVVFMSQESLTGYDNVISIGGSCRHIFEAELSAQCEEVYVYEASTNRLRCASCNPTGARPLGPSSIPGATQISNNFGIYRSRILSEGLLGNSGEQQSEIGPKGDLRVFFDSADKLVPGDNNGVEDVYEYENGKVYLISDGNNAGGASFVDASINGDDAFFITRAQLVQQDTDQLVDLYDARSPHVPGEQVEFENSPVPACVGESCRAPSLGAPVISTPSSAVFVGTGNVTPGATVTVTAKSSPKKKVKNKKHAHRIKGKGRRAASGRHVRARVRRKGS